MSMGNRMWMGGVICGIVLGLDPVRMQGNIVHFPRECELVANLAGIMHGYPTLAVADGDGVSHNVKGHSHTVGLRWTVVMLMAVGREEMCRDCTIACACRNQLDPDRARPSKTAYCTWAEW